MPLRCKIYWRALPSGTGHYRRSLRSTFFVATAVGLCANNATLGVIRSVSKALGPDLSCYCRQRQRDLNQTSATANAGSQWVSHLLQDLVYACLTDPEYQHRLAQTRLFYTTRRKTGPRPTAIWHRHFSRRRRGYWLPLDAIAATRVTWQNPAGCGT